MAGSSSSTMGRENEEFDTEEKKTDVKQVSKGETGSDFRQKYEDHEGK